jgi:hypothetical protein
MNALENVIAAIEKQQPKQRNDVWMVGEQLKDLLKAEPQWAEMVERDLQNQGQKLEDVAKLIRERAKKNKVGNCGVVTPMEADEIIRKTYGIPERGAASEAPAPDNLVSLEDFF